MAGTGPKGEFFITGRLGSKDDQFRGYFSGDGEVGRYAFATAYPDQPLSGKWAESLVRSFIGFEYPVENSIDLVKEFLSESRKMWLELLDWGNLKWYIRNKSMDGVYSSFSGLSVASRDGSIECRGFSSGFDSFFALGPSDKISRIDSAGSAPDIHEFWSGYPSSASPVYRWDVPQNVFFKWIVPIDSRMVLVTPNVSRWILKNPEVNLVTVVNNSDPGVLVRNKMKSGDIDNAESVVLLLERR